MGAQGFEVLVMGLVLCLGFSHPQFQQFGTQQKVCALSSSLCVASCCSAVKNCCSISVRRKPCMDVRCRVMGGIGVDCIVLCCLWASLTCNFRSSRLSKAMCTFELCVKRILHVCKNLDHGRRKSLKYWCYTAWLLSPVLSQFGTQHKMSILSISVCGGSRLTARFAYF